MKYVCGIDPANVQTAYCICDMFSMRPYAFGRKENDEVLAEIVEKCLELTAYGHEVHIAIEGMQSYGQPVGASVFETCYWIGWMRKTFDLYQFDHSLIFRSDERLEICNTSRADDTQIKHALIERFAPYDSNHGKGKKDKPGFFYGFKRDIWQAFAVAFTYRQKNKSEG